MDSPLAAMERAARVAGAALMNRLQHLSTLQVEAKGLNDFVTAADREAEELIAASLEEAWPGVPFLAEEAAGRKAATPPRWIIDPLDGTTNFIHGYPFFSVSIAFEDGDSAFEESLVDALRLVGPIDALVGFGRGAGRGRNSGH